VKLLDLFCGAGGAAMGYHRAGFEVFGVDINPQPRYPFEFHQADAMTYPLDGFDAIHASPPCQGYSRMRHLPWLKDKVYPLLLAGTWERLAAAGVPWVIENVEDAPMPQSTVLCGWTMGLPFYRHRRFGASFLIMAPPHRQHGTTIAAGGASVAQRFKGTSFGIFDGADPGEAAGIGWMTKAELSEAIPPAYTEFIGQQLMAHLETRAA
jgi:DNA (cytosine-5)-methyltransferase 1